MIHSRALSAQMRLAAIVRECAARTWGTIIQVIAWVFIILPVTYVRKSVVFCGYPDVSVAHVFWVLTPGILTRSFHTHTDHHDGRCAPQQNGSSLCLGGVVNLQAVVEKCANRVTFCMRACLQLLVLVISHLRQLLPIYGHRMEVFCGWWDVYFPFRVCKKACFSNREKCGSYLTLSPLLFAILGLLFDAFVLHVRVVMCVQDVSV